MGAQDALLGHLGYLECIVSGSDLILASLSVRSEFRGRGLASLLLSQAVDLASREGLMVQLDDTSDRFAMTGNIYRRFGFQYTEQRGDQVLDCSMVGAPAALQASPLYQAIKNRPPDMALHILQYEIPFGALRKVVFCLQPVP
jgi:GNAT superfamily N-acetyltransferase